MNGKPRDSIQGDVVHGRPTLSPRADELARAVADLSSGNEQEELWRQLQEAANASPAWRAWLADPGAYLSELDANAVTDVEHMLDARLVDLQERARSRGWEPR